MQVTLTAWSDKETCIWCEKEKECVRADFGESFSGDAQFCWRCFQKAVKVQSQKTKRATRRTSAAPQRPDQQP